MAGLDTIRGLVYNVANDRTSNIEHTLHQDMHQIGSSLFHGAGLDEQGTFARS